MKIITWNVNGIRAVEKKDFCSWLANCGADVVCIQETKAKPEQLSENLTAPAGYKAYWASAVKAGYSGTAIYSKSEPDKIDVFGLGRGDGFYQRLSTVGDESWRDGGVASTFGS